ncbi:hypothetical protein ACKC9G_08885 [Pokkaliibacter sp. CJK22405]|uniref:hypothetical protein n=1 Tax=Pokkaliibacter sp. CJK22405 TaxID=3384615 RepID=UPI0039853BAD
MNTPLIIAIALLQALVAWRLSKVDVAAGWGPTRAVALMSLGLGIICPLITLNHWPQFNTIAENAFTYLAIPSMALVMIALTIPLAMSGPAYGRIIIAFMALFELLRRLQMAPLWGLLLIMLTALIGFVLVWRLISDQKAPSEHIKTVMVLASGSIVLLLSLWATLINPDSATNPSLWADIGPGIWWLAVGMSVCRILESKNPAETK